MERQRFLQLFNNFLTGYDIDAKDAIWEAQSKQFRDFWNSKIKYFGNLWG